MIQQSHQFSELPAEVDVLVVGAGVVGLSAALFLQHHGVQPLVVERHPGTSIHPRARGVNVRTMELFREVGVEDAVRAAGAHTPIALGLLSGTTLASCIDKPLNKFVRRSLHALAARNLLRPRNSPTSTCRVTQDHLEPVLADAARARGAALSFHTELVACMQSDDVVTATLRHRETGTERTVRARYVVAADGAKSPMRERLGISTSGRGVIGTLLNVLFRAPALEAYVRGRSFSMALLDNGSVRGLLASINNRDVWVFHVVYDRTVESPESYTHERCRALIGSALGVDVPIAIQSVLPWESASKVADRYRAGRIFLAGDAAHLMPPWGGQGANTGIADAHDLAWKLAFVLRHDAPDALLDSYESERRPIGFDAAERSADRAAADGLMAPFTFKRMFGASPSDAVMTTIPLPSTLHKLTGLGIQHRSSSFQLERNARRRWALDGRPGTRLPHAWVERAGVRTSSLDLVDGFTLLLGAQCEDVRAPEHVRAVRMGRDVHDTRTFVRAARLGSRGAMLVRPDGFVVWRRDDDDTRPLDVQVADAHQRARGVSG